MSHNSKYGYPGQRPDRQPERRPDRPSDGHADGNPLDEYDTDFGSASRQGYNSNYGQKFEPGGRTRFLNPESGYGEDFRSLRGRSRDDVRSEVRPEQRTGGRPDVERFERDEYLQTRNGLPGFHSSPRSGSGYIYGSDSHAEAFIDHSGRGPKNWKRSDERICEDVSEILARHPAIDASEIEVNVKDGVVVLSGSVDHRRSKRLVEDVIDHVSGLKDVKNELNVNQSLFNQDREILTGENAPNDKRTPGKSRH